MTDQNQNYERILVTGGAGFIGQKLCRLLVENGHYVRILDNFSSQVHSLNADESEVYDLVDVNRGDVRVRGDLERALNDIDAVFHLAAETGTAQSMYEISQYVSVNAAGTANLLDIVANKRTTIKKIILASSRAVYGEGKYFCKEHGEIYPTGRNEELMRAGDFAIRCPQCGRALKILATDEATPANPVSVYALTKHLQEQLLLLAQKATSIPSVVLRFQNVYGPGQSLKNPYTGILSIFSTMIKNSRDIEIYEDGEECRDFVYVDDVVSACYSALLKPEAGGQILNVGSGVPSSVIYIAEKLIQLYGVQVNANISSRFRVGDIRGNFADMSKTSKILGFEPKFAIEQGLELFAAWVNSQVIPKQLYEQSVKELIDRNLIK